MASFGTVVNLMHHGTRDDVVEPPQADPDMRMLQESHEWKGDAEKATPLAPPARVGRYPQNPSISSSRRAWYGAGAELTAGLLGNFINGYHDPSNPIKAERAIMDDNGRERSIPVQRAFDWLAERLHRRRTRYGWSFRRKP